MHSAIQDTAVTNVPPTQGSYDDLFTLTCLNEFEKITSFSLLIFYMLTDRFNIHVCIYKKKFSNMNLCPNLFSRAHCLSVFEEPCL